MARILIVEDNPDNMKLFRAILAMKGHQITALSSGDGLLEELAAHPPDLVLMDIQLPGRDGFELLSEIRASDHGRVKVVALTGHAGILQLQAPAPVAHARGHRQRQPHRSSVRRRGQARRAAHAAVAGRQELRVFRWR